VLDPDVIKTAIVAISSIVTAAIAGLVTLRQINKKQNERQSEVSEEDQAAEDRYMADPGLFVRDVLDSNRQYAEEVKAYRLEVAGLRKELADRGENDRKFRTALARWVVRLMDKFAEHDLDMPLPDEHDAAILADVIPSALEATRPRPPRFLPT
jgi:hypothetical protein